MVNEVKEGKVFRVKQYMLWIRLLARRLWRQPVYVALFILMPLLGYAAGFMEHEAQSGTAVAVCIEDGAWKEAIMAMLSEQEADSILRFVYLDERGAVERYVAAGKADCGFVIASDLEEKVLDGAWQKSITVFETDSGSAAGIARERLAGVIFRLYAEECYERYMGQFPDTAAAFARDAYERRLVDDSTVRFQYFYGDSISQSDYDMLVKYDNDIDGPVNNDADGTVNKQGSTAVFPVKGVFAVLIFLGGLCGMLEYERDKMEKRFIRMAPDILTCLVNIWISTIFISAAALISQWFYDGLRYCGSEFNVNRMLTVWSGAVWGRESRNLLIYQCIIIVYCIMLRQLLRRQEMIAAAMPILTMGSLICGPVFIRLGAYLPIFTVLEKLFPVTYYLML